MTECLMDETATKWASRIRTYETLRRLAIDVSFLRDDPEIAPEMVGELEELARRLLRLEGAMQSDALALWRQISRTEMPVDHQSGG